MLIVKALVPPVTAPLTLIAPLPADKIVSAVKVIPVLPSPNVIVVLVVATVPARLIALGAVATKPPVKVILSPAALPIVKVPVFAKVVALVMTFAAPFNSKA